MTTLTAKYQQDEKTVYEFIVKGEVEKHIAECNRISQSWNLSNPQYPSGVIPERTYVTLRVVVEEERFGEEFLKFVESGFVKAPDDLPQELKKSIEIEFCSIVELGNDTLTVRFVNPNFFLTNLNQAISILWPGSIVEYGLKKFPIHLKILPDPKLNAEEYIANVEDRTEIIFWYNPELLSPSSAFERGISFFFNWLNRQMIAFHPGDENLERNWPYDPETEQIRWKAFEIAWEVFYSFNFEEIDRDPLEFCLLFLRKDPLLSYYFSDQIFQELMDKYPGESPFLGRAKKLKFNLEAAKGGENFKNLESNHPFEGEI